MERSIYTPHTQDSQVQWLIALVLLALMMFTRAGFLVDHTSDVSSAAFFLLGFYLRNYVGLGIFLLSAVLLDTVMIASRGGAEYMNLTPVYFFTLPAYAAVWLGGRFCATHYTGKLTNLALFFVVAVVSMVANELCSGGSFYIATTPLAELSVSEYLQRVKQFFPCPLRATLIYLALASIAHIAIAQALRVNTQRIPST